MVVCCTVYCTVLYSVILYTVIVIELELYSRAAAAAIV
jgi:hypothetical protein